MNNLNKIAKHFKKLSLCEGCGCGGSTPSTPNPPMSQQLRPNQLNDPNFIAQIVAQVVQQMGDSGRMQEQNIDSKNPGADPFQKLYDKQNPNDPKAIPGKHFPNTIKKVIDLKMDSDVGEPVTVEYTPGTNLTDVTISWGSESHTVDFEAGDIIDDHGNEGMDIETSADSDDGRWQFILDVQAEATFPMTGDFADWDWEELIVQSHPDDESHLDPEDRFDQDPQ